MGNRHTINEEQKFDFEGKKDEIKKFIRKIQAGETTTQWDNPFYKLIVGDTMGALGASEKAGFTKDIKDKWKDYFSSKVFYTDGVWSQRDFNAGMKRKSGDRTYNFYITVEKTKENIMKFWSSLGVLDQKLKRLSDERQSPISYKTHRLMDAFIAHNDSLKVYYYDGDLKGEVEKAVSDWVSERGISKSSRTHSHGIDKKDDKGDKRSFGEHLALYMGNELKKNIEKNPGYTEEQWYQWVKSHMPDMLRRVRVDNSNVNESHEGMQRLRGIVRGLVKKAYL